MSTVAHPLAPPDAPTALRIEVVTTASGLAEKAGAWDALARRADRPGLLAATYAWFCAYTTHRAGGAPWGCIFASREDRLVGVLPYVVRPHRLLGARRPWLHVPSDVHTTGGDLLLDAEQPEEAANALLGAAFAAVPGAIAVRLGGLWPDTPTNAALDGRPRTLRVEEELAGRSVPLTDTWETYHAALGGNHRRNLRKARNRLRKAGAVSIRHSPGAAGLEDFVALEQGGWKGRVEGAVACDTALAGFYRTLTELLAERDMVIWHRLDLDDRTLAMAMELRIGRQVVLQRVAFDEAERRLSPGQVLLADLLEGWFGEGDLLRVDCLTDQPWHETWQMERAPYRAAWVFARGPVGRVAGAWPLRVREGLRRSPTLRRWVRKLRGGDST